MKRRVCMGNATHQGGFSLMELLVVMAILATLGGLAVVGIPRIMRNSQSKAVGVVITQLATTLEAYAARPTNGDFPPTVLDPEGFPGVGVLTNKENCGIESLLVCLNRPGQGTSFEVEDVPWDEALDNLDGDQTQLSLSTIGGDRDRQLFELLDRWGTPFAYFHHRDYDSIETKNLGRISALDGGAISAKPWKNPKTKTWFKARGFQLISAGPDLEFNTEDDITNFKR